MSDWVADDTRTRLLLYVVEYYELHNYGPSSPEMMDAVGLSSRATIFFHLVRLKRDGLVNWDVDRSRTLRPLVRPVPFGVKS